MVAKTIKEIATIDRNRLENCLVPVIIRVEFQKQFEWKISVVHSFFRHCNIIPCPSIGHGRLICCSCILVFLIIPVLLVNRSGYFHSRFSLVITLSIYAMCPMYKFLCGLFPLFLPFIVKDTWYNNNTYPFMLVLSKRRKQRLPVAPGYWSGLLLNFFL